MDLLDFLGNAFGAPGDGDLSAQMLAQLGGDPAAMRRAAAQQALGQFGAAMLARSGPSLQPQGFGQALGAAMQAGQTAMGDARSQQLNHLYTLENMKRAKAADDAAALERQKATDLQAWLQRPDTLANLPPELKPWGGMLAQLDPKQAVSMIVSAQSQSAQDRRQDSREEAAAKRQQAMFEQQNATQERIAARQLAAQAAAANRAPWFTGHLEDQGAMGDAARVAAGLAPKGVDPNGLPALSKPQQQAVERRATQLQDQMAGASNANQLIDTIAEKFQSGYYAPSGNPIARAWNANAPAAYRSDRSNELDKDLNDLVVQVQQSMKGRQSVALLHAIQASKPSIGMSPDTIQSVLTNWKGQLAHSNAITQAELDHYANGGSVEGFKMPGPGAGAADAGVGTAAPPSQLPPPGAVRGPDGSWYNPKTGRRYVWQPGG